MQIQVPGPGARAMLQEHAKKAAVLYEPGKVQWPVAKQKTRRQRSTGANDQIRGRPWPFVLAGNKAAPIHEETSRGAPGASGLATTTIRLLAQVTTS